MKHSIERSSALLFALILALAAFAHSQVTPFMAVGNAQFFDNNGKPLTSGVLYSFQAGTSTQQATYTDYTGLFQNPNPIPFGSGARVSIWLTSSLFYKFVLCLQNDGASCAPADVLFSVDQVPGCPGCTGNGSTFTGTFISGTASPATSGALRLASLDSICWRNTAGTVNLCIAKDSSDVLSWGGGVVKFPQIGCGVGSVSYDYLCASSTNNRWLMSNNGGALTQIVGAGVDVNNSDQVTQVHFGASAAPFSATLPGTNQLLQWNGTNIVGYNCTLQFKTAAYTLAAGDCIIHANVSAGGFTLTIPHATTGVIWHITRGDQSGNTLTIAPDANQVNALASITVSVGSSFDCHADGVNSWCFGGTGFEQFVSAGGCTASGSPCTVTTSWPSTWPDTTYSVYCTPTSEASNSAAIWWISSKTTTQFVISIDNRGTSNPGGYGGFDCRGHHN